MQFYEIGKCYDFEVVQTENLSESYFRLLLHDGVTEVKLPKIKFQMDKPLPSRLKCRIKGVDNGQPIVDHFIPQYVNKFYAKGAARHEIFSFTVISVPTRAEDPFYLRDANGIIFRLYEQGAILSLNQTVKCRFEKLDSIKFILKRVDDGLQLPFLTLDEICEQLKIRSFERRFISESLMKMPSLSGAAEELAASNPRWPLTFLHQLEQHFAEWFISADVRRRYRAVRKLFTYYREAALLLLEGSHFLSNCNDDIRHNMQLQLTEMIEMVDPYLTSLKIINEGNQAEFVEGLMDKLRKSGYLYHPTLQFAILMLVFRLYPELVDKYLSKIFDVIMSRNLSTWTTDTFSNAFVEQFEIYIRQARHAIDDLPQAESQDENHRLETIITAIALQLFMAKSETFPAFDRNTALFYRYIALLRPVKARDLLTKSFLSLLGVNMPHNFTYDDIKEPIKMMTLATVMPQMLEDSALQALPTAHMLTSGKIALKISKDGIELRRIDMPTNERVIPNGVMEWLQPQIYHNGITPIKSSNKLDNHNKWWREIENDLFGAKPIINSNIREHRRQALIGDDVYVIITGTGYDDKGNPKLFCRIDDDEYESVSGCILREQIVGYRVAQISRDAYVNERGVPFHFYAKVVDIESDGNYQFSLKAEAEKAIRELVDYQTEYCAVITSEPSPDYSAICSKGFGLYLIHNEGEDYNVTDKVRFRIVDSVNGIYRGEILGDAFELDLIDNVRAFTNLMNEMALEPSDDEMVDAEQYSSGVAIDNYEELNKEDLKEIIEIIRFKALLDKELVEAFDYLNFARILALLIDEKETADKLGAHASMLIMHEYFATNSRIDSDKLKALEPIVETSPLLKIIYKRLEIVSWLGDKDRMSDLLDIIKDARNELEANLARMVLSYNMILETESADSQIADSIRKKIMTLLKVNSETRQLKYYGSESLYVEFKSSIVYPARRKGEMLTADPEAQQFIILKVIASFLNAGGGTLFIGVNDATHYESGLQNDFDYYRNHVAQVGTYFNKIKDADNVAVFLANLVNYTFGDAIGRLVEIAPDPEAKKDVIVVKVKQTLDPVPLKDVYYERQSSTIRALRNPEEQRRFLADRKAQKLLQAVRSKADAKDEHDLVEAEPGEVVEEQKPKVTQSVEVAPLSEDTIATSSWRENVLHYYFDNYVEPKAYIYFGDGPSVKYTKEDTFEDDKSRLTLVVKDSEIDAYLVLIFADERAIKVPIEELLRLNPREQMRYDTERPLVFAGIAHAKDAVLSIHSDARNALWQRVTPLKSIESGHIGNSPTRIMDVAVNETLRYEIVDASKTKQFAKSMPDEIRTNDIGFNMHRKTDGMNTPETIQELIEMCAPVKD